MSEGYTPENRDAMKVFVEGTDIIKGFIELDRDEYRNSFLRLLPRNAEGLFYASNNGESFKFIQGNQLWDNPVVRINGFFESEYRGVDERGVSLLVFEKTGIKEAEYELYLGMYPSYISLWGETIQIIFKLVNFVPKNATEHSLYALEGIMASIESHLSGCQTDDLINPFCHKTKSYIFNTTGLTFSELGRVPKIHASKEHIKQVRGKGGIIAAAMRADKSKDKISHAIKILTTVPTLVE